MGCIKIGLLRETKVPPDRRVAIPPDMALEIKARFPEVEIIVQPSPIRCFSDQEYAMAGFTLSEDLSDCDWLIGVKEVHLPTLLEGKKYLFFAHVAKRQAYNRPLLQEILRKRITLIDYEYLKDDHDVRLIAFGRWAGIVGAYNGLRAWGLKTGRYQLPAAHDCHDRFEMDARLENLDTGPLRILVSGGGRVAQGALETLARLKLPALTPEEFLSNPDLTPAVCRIDPWHYAARKDGGTFNWEHFCKNPGEYRSGFLPYAASADLFIAAHFWDPASPRFWEPAEMAGPDFRIRVIADISCDINGSIPSTIRATTIADPFYDWDRLQWKEMPPFSGDHQVTVMSIDNLPGELPRDASEEFARVLMEKVLPCMLGEDPCQVIHRATIAAGGRLNEPFNYLESFVGEWISPDGST